MIPLFALVGVICLAAAVVSIFLPEKMAVFVRTPTRAKVIGSSLAMALLCFIAVLAMTLGDSNPALRGPSRSRYALPAGTTSNVPSLSPIPAEEEAPQKGN